MTSIVGFISLINTLEAVDKPKGRQQKWYKFPLQKNLQNFLWSDAIGITKHVSFKLMLTMKQSLERNSRTFSVVFILKCKCLICSLSSFIFKMTLRSAVVLSLVNIFDMNSPEQFVEAPMLPLIINS